MSRAERVSGHAAGPLADATVLSTKGLACAAWVAWVWLKKVAGVGVGPFQGS